MTRTWTIDATRYSPEWYGELVFELCVMQPKKSKELAESMRGRRTKGFYSIIERGGA